jgi:hypothetical protein
VRDRPTDKVERGRFLGGRLGSPAGMRYGAFKVNGPCDRELVIIADDGNETAWEHVSVSVDAKHPPNWQEMSWVKDQFWRDDETVLQFHPRKSEYVNCHPSCLHLWRNIGLDHPLPPSILVGPKLGPQ